MPDLTPKTSQEVAEQAVTVVLALVAMIKPTTKEQMNAIEMMAKRMIQASVDEHVAYLIAQADAAGVSLAELVKGRTE